MFILESERLKLIPLNDYNLASYRVLEKIEIQKYQENEKMFWWRLNKNLNFLTFSKDRLK